MFFKTTRIFTKSFFEFDEKRNGFVAVLPFLETRQGLSLKVALFTDVDVKRKGFLRYVFVFVLQKPKEHKTTKLFGSNFVEKRNDNDKKTIRAHINVILSENETNNETNTKRTRQEAI
jgi:hypothetical protein